MSPRRSSRRDHSDCWYESQLPNSTNPAGLTRQLRVRPDLLVVTRPQACRICRCWLTAVSVMFKGSARCDTDCGPLPNRSTKARRVGSPRAWNTLAMFTFPVPAPVCRAGSASPFCAFPGRRPRQNKRFGWCRSASCRWRPGQFPA